MTNLKAILMTMLLTLAGSAWSAAQNVSGTITCDGQGVAGVAVSDGHQIVLTDNNGHYAMTSDKQCGYVFYTLPGGYEPMLTDGFKPQFWSSLTSSDVTIAEEHDFVLRRVDNDKHIVIFGADTHLARRYSDRGFFKKGMIVSLGDEVARAGGTPVYSVLLGDLTWDVFWYQNDYDLSHFMADMSHYNYPMPLWPVIGNHDHDPSAMPWNNTDWVSSGLWRTVMCPTYYSFNLGQVHYVVLDDIIYKNEPRPGEEYPEGVMGSRNYLATITDEQLAWLSADLALIDKETPLVVCMHIPAWGVTSTFGYYTKLYNTGALCTLLEDFDNVNIMSGHVHTNNTTRPVEYPNIVEHSVAATSGSLWLTAAVSGHHICQDGSPAGYLRWTVDGTRTQWYYKPIHEGERQMRLYDMNTVGDFYRTNSAMRAILDDYPSRVDYSQLEHNTVMVNVFGYDTKWRVDICEGDSLLQCSRVYNEDPYHTLAYDVPQYSTGSYYSTSYATSPTAHLFTAQASTADRPITVRAIDPFGNIYLKSITRPHPYGLTMENHEQDLLVGDTNVDNEVNITDVNLVIDIILGKGTHTRPIVVADCNGDNEVNIADINKIITLIVKNNQ